MVWGFERQQIDSVMVTGCPTVSRYRLLGHAKHTKNLGYVFVIPVPSNTNFLTEMFRS